MKLMEVKDMKNYFKNGFESFLSKAIAFVVVIFVSLIIILMVAVVSPTLKAQREKSGSDFAQSLPMDYEEHPLIILSLDGFTPDYLDYGLTPSLEALIKNGTSALFMEPTYPTNTFPNHYSVVTGLYPESHGIIDSRFFDPDLNKSFSRKTNALNEGFWWGGDPIWNTVQRQGKKSAAFFWVGSEAPIRGLQPTHWRKYDHTIPFEEKIDQVLKWVSLPPSKRPIWTAVYFNEPDYTGHRHGPKSSQVKNQLVRIDKAITRLTDGLEELNLTKFVNLIVISDHGIAEAGEQRSVNLKELMPDIEDVFEFSPRSLERFNISQPEAIDSINAAFSCNDAFKLYHKNDLPKRLHFSYNNRIHDFVFLYKEGVIPILKPGKIRMAEHGYDPGYQSMKSLFIARGPDFKQGKMIEPFKNIELYNLMCHLVDVEPSPNNGTPGALYDALNNPPPLQERKDYESYEILRFSTDTHFNEETHQEFCNESDEENALMDEFNLVETEILEDGCSELQCAPWGLPAHSNEQDPSIKVLQHPDHLTGYSLLLGQPLWTTFLIDGLISEYNIKQWLTDRRLPPNVAPNCSERNATLADGAPFELTPLFRPEFCKNSSFQLLTRLVTNAVPISSFLRGFWNYFLSDFLSTKIQTTEGPLNIIIGPIFDKDKRKFHSNPTSMFAVFLWCRNSVDSLHKCEERSLDVNAFIFPLDPHFKSCFTSDEFIKTYMATLQDVERETSLIFFPKLKDSIRISLILRLIPHFRSNFYQYN